ncbi:Fe-S cluster assembly protein SufD [Nibricoccus sp. IMCC34717]|uniref:Fe-S cluster assembly protein SufD n=1 Tax=Nibricoccus sp. IMCC34717 TaxID=3034021 RepID=UPI00384B6337
MSSATTLSTSGTALINGSRFASHVGQRSALPKWWLDAKQAAWNQFLALPMPSRTDELWRFSTLKGLDLERFETAEAVANAPAVPTLSGFNRAAEITFLNNHLAHRTALPQDLAEKGVVFCPLEEALLKHPEAIKAVFQKHAANLGSEKFVALNTALAASGAFLHVPAGVEVALPFVIQHGVSGDHRALFPHTIVSLGANAKATVVESFASADSHAHFSSGVNDLIAGPGAHLTYVGTQRWSGDTLAIQSNSIVAQRDARVLSLNLHLGGRQARHESHSRLQGPGAHSEMLALTVATGSQEFDQRTLQTHQAPHTSSNLLYKNALIDQARTIFSGLIVVEPDAQKTDAYQSNRNLMLSGEAEANSLPGLEIQANDVRCTHGSTSGRIDPEQEFYLQSRGINASQAHELLVFGFFEEVLGKLDNDEIHDALRAAIIDAKFRNA